MSRNSSGNKETRHGAGTSVPKAPTKGPGNVHPSPASRTPDNVVKQTGGSGRK